MTYKGVRDSGDWIQRTGSHSTRPLRNGRIDDLPLTVRQPEEYFNSVKDRWEGLKDQLRQLQERLSVVNKQLRSTLPYEEFKRLETEKQKLAALYRQVEQEMIAHHKLARAAALNAYGIVWRYVCEQMLAPEMCEKIRIEVQEIIKRRDDGGMPLAHDERPLHEQAERAEKHRQKERRAEFRKKRPDLGPNERLVWSDELGGRIDRDN